MQSLLVVTNNYMIKFLKYNIVYMCFVYVVFTTADGAYYNHGVE